MIPGSSDRETVSSLHEPLLSEFKEAVPAIAAIELQTIYTENDLTDSALPADPSLPIVLPHRPEVAPFLEVQGLIEIPAAVTEFLSSLSIDPQEVAADREFISTLNQILSVEQNPYRSNLRWANVDSVLERLALMLVLKTEAINNQPIENSKHIFLHGRAIPLQQPRARQSVLAIRNFIRGAELTVFDAIHYFFYGLLSYHFYQLLSTGRSDFSDLRAALFSTTDNGLVNLVRGFAQLPPALLKSLLAISVVPTIALTIRGFLQKKLWNKDDAGVERYIQEALPRDLPTFLYTECWQWLPIIPTSNKLQNLERLVRWHGHLSAKSLDDLIGALEHLARTSDNYIQRTAMSSLAKIIHSFHARDMLHLKGIHTPEQLQHYLKLKQQALTTLQNLSHFKVEGTKKERTIQYATQSMRVLYANYLLWWLGFSPSIMASFFFTAMKGVKLGLEITLLVNLIKTIQDALSCPQQPDFVFGEGFVQQWAGDFTAKCFTARLQLFRKLNPQESVDGLIQELQQYHLAGLTTLDLSNKYLTNDKAIKLINAIVNRGAQITNLDLSQNSLTKVTSELFTNLPQLQQVNLKNQYLTVIDSGAFVNLPQLQTLYLGGSRRLTTIPSNAFVNLPQLQRLDLSWNQLTTMPSNAFVNLPQLQKLDLSRNQLTSLSSNVFSNLPQLQTLDVSANKLINVLSNAFVNLPQLQTLYLDLNQLTGLSVNALVNLPQLQTLLLSGNRLINVPSDVFANLPQLQTLSLDNNQLTVLPNNSFVNLPQMQTLDLSYNRLTIAMSKVFVNLLQLQTLNISANYLTELSSDMFVNVPMLQTLLLSGNQLINVPSDTLVDVPSLQTLFIDGNQFTTIPNNAFVNLPQLQNLRLAFSKLVVMPIINVPKLQSLDLSYNLLNTLPSNAFINLTQLQWLDLAVNHFTSLQSDVFADLYLLQTLYLGGNRLTSISPKVFVKLPLLQELDLSYNQLTVVPSDALASIPLLQNLALDGNYFTSLLLGSFYNLPRLLTLSVSSNPLLASIQSNAFVNLTQLQTLYIYGNNNLTFVSPSAFFNLTQLHTLDMGGNQLTAMLPNTFSNLPQLTMLNLYGGQLIRVLPNTFFNLPKLQYLDLRFNRLTIILSNAFDSLQQLQTLYLSHNNISVIVKDALINVNMPQGQIYLGGQRINDEALYNLTQCLPKGVNTLELSYNHITSAGFEVLASILPCTNITSLDLEGNPANTSSLDFQTQANFLRQQCEAQRCLDVWPNQVCEVVPPPEVTPSVSHEQEKSLPSKSFSTWSWHWFKGFVNSTVTKVRTLIDSHHDEENISYIRKDIIHHTEELSSNNLPQGFNDAAGDDLALQTFQTHAHSLPEFLSGKDSSTTQHDIAHADKAVTSSTINSYQLITNALPHSDMVVRTVYNNANNFTAASTNNNAQIIASALVAGATALSAIGCYFWKRNKSQNIVAQKIVQSTSHLNYINSRS